MSVDRLRYVDQVIDFHPGGQIKAGTNKHADPNAVLGDITRKKPDTFVSLGALGELSVGIAGEVISAQGDDDITVFVHPDDSLRPYRVEALSTGGLVAVRAETDWLPLGASSGVTQSFSLRKAGLANATIIRILDDSGRSRDIFFNDSSSPGTSIVGIGVKATAPFPGGLPSWLQSIKQVTQLPHKPRGLG